MASSSKTPQIQLDPTESIRHEGAPDLCCFCIPYDVFTDDITNDYNLHNENRKKKEKRKLKENGIGRLTMYVLTAGKKGRVEMKKSAVEIKESELPDREVDLITGHAYVKSIDNKEKHDKILAKHGKTGPEYHKNEKFDFLTRITVMVKKHSGLSIGKKGDIDQKSKLSGVAEVSDNQGHPVETNIISQSTLTSEDKQILAAPERPGVLTENDFQKTQKAKDQKECKEKNRANQGKMRQKTVYYKSNSVFGRVFDKRKEKYRPES